MAAICLKSSARSTTHWGGLRLAGDQRADLCDKGVCYRTVIGPFGTAEEASQFCAGLKPQSDAASRRMLASATGMAAALSFGCPLAGTVVSAFLPRLS